MMINNTTFYIQLLDVIFSEIHHHDTRHHIFHGSWDWHSSVHGHWAGLWLSKRLMRMTENLAICQRLESAKFIQEMDELLLNTNFEMPYGRAWLLLLGIEYYSQMGSHLPSLEGVASSLHKWLVESPNLDIGEYQNPGWVVVRLHHWYHILGNREGVVFCQQCARRLLESPIPSLGRDFRKAEFFSVWGMAVLLIHQVFGANELSSWLRTQQVTETDLSPVIDIKSVHHLGMNPSRAWAFWLCYAVTKEMRWVQAFESHLKICYEHFETYSTNRHAYRHWVPQFVTYALWMQSQTLVNTVSRRH